MVRFNILPRGATPPGQGTNAVYLIVDHWNDYSFVTMFYVYAHDEQGRFHDLGNIKIGFKGQTIQVSTYSTLAATFHTLNNNYFSVGNDVQYYRVLGHDTSSDFRDAVTTGLRDICALSDAYEIASGEEVFRTSLLRSLTVSTIDGQYRRVLGGGAPLTEFKFVYSRPADSETAGISLSFDVLPNSSPSTNIHAIIGRNGIGKTTLLNGMTSAVMNKPNAKGFFTTQSWMGSEPLGDKYFSSLISVAFSAFDPFAPPPDQSDPEKGTCYYYIGLKNSEDSTGTQLKSLDAMREELAASLSDCFQTKAKRNRWLTAIETLESDANFAAMGLPRAVQLSGGELKNYAHYMARNMSSGHAIVLLTITRLVSRVEEKTLILLDEPESHLHPPLLSAFTRALSELLISRNGVAIIATHSPVVLQEVPKSCVWFVSRWGLTMEAERPRIETFGENVGILTREVFGLEVANSGFHTLLSEAVFKKGKSYEEVVADYGGQLGFEAKTILKSMVISRDQSGQLK